MPILLERDPATAMGRKADAVRIGDALLNAQRNCVENGAREAVSSVSPMATFNASAGLVVEYLARRSSALGLFADKTEADIEALMVGWMLVRKLQYDPRSVLPTNLDWTSLARHIAPP